VQLAGDCESVTAVSDLKSMFQGGNGTKSSRVLRWLIPILMIVAGLVLIGIGSSEVMTGLGVALALGSTVVIFAGWLARLDDDSERIREEDARDVVRRTGRWPDEQ